MGRRRRRRVEAAGGVEGAEHRPARPGEGASPGGRRHPSVAAVERESGGFDFCFFLLLFSEEGERGRSFFFFFSKEGWFGE